DDAEERARLARVFAQGLGSVVGYALPLQPELPDAPRARSRWRSGPWSLRGERLVLVPGDSPMGHRLPLDALPWVAATDMPLAGTRAGRGERPALPSRRTRARLPYAPLREASGALGPAERSPESGESAGWLTRTALCIEPRDGMLHVFLPPLSRLEDF